MQNPEQPFAHPGGREDVMYDPELKKWTQLSEDQRKLTDDYEKNSARKKRGHEKLYKKLEKIDFADIERILRLCLRRCGVAMEHVNFIGPQDFEFLGETDYSALALNKTESKGKSLGRYYNFSNKILIPLSMHRADSVTTKPMQEIEFLQTIIHEEVHAISKSVQFYETRDGKAHLHAMTNGYRYDNSEDSLLVQFDEAITERLALQVTKEYLERHPELTKAVGKGVVEICETMRMRSGYAWAIFFVEYLIRNVEDAAGMPKEMVFNALVRSKMRGPIGETFDIKGLCAIDMDGDSPPKKGAPVILPTNIYLRIKTAETEEEIKSVMLDFETHFHECRKYVYEQKIKVQRRSDNKRSEHVIALLLKILPGLNDVGHSLAR